MPDRNYPDKPKNNGDYFGKQPLFKQNEDTSPNIDDDDIDLKKLYGILMRRKWMVIGLTLLGLAAAWAYAAWQIPVYQSEGTLIITESQRSGGSGSDLQEMLAATYGVGMGSRIANELQVLRSRQLSLELADKVIEAGLLDDGQQFPLLWTTFREDSTVAHRSEVARRIRDRMNVDRVERESDVVSISYQSYSPKEARWMIDQIIETYGELSTEQNRMAASAALQFLEQERDEIQQHLAETQDKLREFMSTTGLVQIDAQTSGVIDRISELEGRRQEIQTRLVAVNSAVGMYEQQLDQIKPGLADRYAESVAPTLERYQFRLAELETERLLYITRNPSLRQNPESEPDLVQINDQIEMLKEEINTLASRMIGDDGDEFLSFLTSSDGNIATRITDLRNRLIELQVEQTQYAAQDQAIAERLEIENRFFDDLPDNMVELASHRRDVEINENLFETISAQYAEMALWEQTQFGLGRPLDYGYVPESPVSPNVPMYLLIGLTLGGLFGVGLALLRESTNNRIDGVARLSEAGYPVLSVIPDQEPMIKKHFDGRESVEVKGHIVSTRWMTLLRTISPISESFRRLHTNIIYSQPDEKLKTILVTSCSQSEGKTTTAVNLATVLAESGRKVLLIDLDLRKPMVHDMTGTRRSPGLMEVLFDSVPMKEAVTDTLMPNLHIMNTSRIAPNPSTVMQSKKLTDLIYKLKECYDHIVIDTAPYGIITDAAPMIRLADGIVVTARFGVTNRQELRQTLTNLEQIRANILGTVMTFYRHDSSADYHQTSSDYQYYYNYGNYEEYHNGHPVDRPESEISRN